jgi:hypothetical protein
MNTTQTSPISLLPILTQDLVVSDGQHWIRASALARHLGQPIDHVHLMIEALRQTLSEAWWLRHVRQEGLDVRLSRDGVAMLPLDTLSGLRLKALCLTAFEAKPLGDWHEDRPEHGGAEEPDEVVAARRPGHGSSWHAHSGEDPESSATQPTSGPGSLIPVPFQGATLFVVEHAGEPYTPMRPIVEGMGLDWKSQYRRLTNDTNRWGVVMMTIPSQGGLQETLCIPQRKVAGWLMTIEARRVRPELRAKVRAYQNECDEVLWRHWMRGRGQRASAPPSRPETARGEFSLDERLFTRLYYALDRRLGPAAVLWYLLSAGALEQWVTASVREIAKGVGQAVNPTTVHKYSHVLNRAGLIEMADSRYRVVELALRQILANVPEGHDLRPGLLNEILLALPDGTDTWH